MLARALACLVLTGAVLAPTAQAGPFDTPYGPGFKVSVGGDALVECSVGNRRLRCLNYSGRLPAGASCDFGGAVATAQLRRTGSARTAYTCVDEAFHGWKTLRRGSTFRSGAFRCTHRRLALSCGNGGNRFAIDRRGRVSRS